MSIFLIFLYTTLTLSSIPASSQLDQFTYNGFRDQNTNNISLSHATRFNRNGILQLTTLDSMLTGHAFYSSPFRFKNSTNGTASSFSTCFAFFIHPSNPGRGGDGLAFVIAPSRDFSSAMWGGNLGLFNASNGGNFSNHILAVEFDTYQNSESGDINDNHVGIDINSIVSNISASAASSGNGINLKGDQRIMAWIEYDSVTSFLNVSLSLSSSKPRMPLLSLQRDLSPILEETMYVGFSAATGLVSNAQYILGWSLNMNGEAVSLNLNSLPSVPRIQRKQYHNLIIGVSVATFVFMLTSIVIVVFLIKKIKNAELIESWELEIGPHRYKYVELKKATRGFKDSELLGSGGFGCVYRGTLKNPEIQVAVKRISHQSKQGVREFVSEISTIGRFRHRNLVQLLGWCRRGGDLLLVYDFMPNGSLDKFLFEESKHVLTWEQRFKIIKGVASGLFYLHEGYEQIVIHRDVKASNVLLDGDMNGRVGDFGLAKLYDHGSNPGTTRIVGTIGYLAPELARTGRATTSSDVFAFGTLLLEVTCGRRPIELKAQPEELDLIDYVWNKWREGSILDVVDPVMKGDFNEDEVLMVLKLGLMCLSNEQMSRPSMRQVVSYLEGEIETPDVLRAPGASERGGFEDYLHSYTSSTFETMISRTSDAHV